MPKLSFFLFHPPSPKQNRRDHIPTNTPSQKSAWPRESLTLPFARYTSCVEAYVDYTRRSGSGAAFGWDDIVVLTSALSGRWGPGEDPPEPGFLSLHPLPNKVAPVCTEPVLLERGTGKTYQEMLSMHLKFSPRDFNVNRWLVEHIHYKTRKANNYINERSKAGSASSEPGVCLWCAGCVLVLVPWLSKEV